MARMKAVLYENYGGPEVLKWGEVERPQPRPREVLVRVSSTSVTAADCLVRQGRPRWGQLILGLVKPRRKVLGTEFSGVVEEVGPGTTEFVPGDPVFGFTGFSLGAYAEFVCLPESGSLAQVPAGVPVADAVSLVDGPTTALHFLRDRARLKAGQRVLILGATGSVGGAGVQIARWLGAEVTAVTGPWNGALARSLGADTVIDYSQEDFTQGTRTYDVIFDAVTKSTFSRCRRVLAPQGVYLPTSGLGNLVLSWLTAWRPGPRVVIGFSVHKKQALAVVRDLVESKSLRAVIDRRYPGSEVVEAHRYVDQGHKRGNVVVDLVESPIERPGMLLVSREHGSLTG